MALPLSSGASRFWDVRVVPLIQILGPYTTLTTIGGAIKIPVSSSRVGAKAYIIKLNIADADGIHIPMQLYFFRKAAPTAVDNTTFAPTAGDLANYVGKIVIASGNYITYNSADSEGDVVGGAGDIVFPFKTQNTNSLWMAAVPTGTPTYVHANALTFDFTFDQEL